MALENATIRATVDSTATSSGGSAFGTGTSLAVNGTIATNLILSSAKATIIDSTVTARDAAGGNADVGHLTVKADNTSTLDATNKSMTTSGDTAVGITLAFNSIGWMPTNVLFNSIDALLGDPLVSSALNGERPGKVEASIQNSTIDVDGALSTTAVSTATITANTSNVTTSSASALFGATGKAIGGILTTNKVSSSARAYIGDADYSSASGVQWVETRDRVEHNGTVYEFQGAAGAIDLANSQQNYAASANWQTVAVNNDIDVDDGLTITADDNATIMANNKLKALSTTTNDGGLSILADFIESAVNEYNFTTHSGLQDVKDGDLVRLASDYVDAGGAAAESVYRYKGADAEVDIGAQNYGNPSGAWVKIDPLDLSSFIPPGVNLNVTSSDATAIGGLLVANDVRGEVAAFIDNADVEVDEGQTANNTRSCATRTTWARPTPGSTWPSGPTRPTGGRPSPRSPTTAAASSQAVIR